MDYKLFFLRDYSGNYNSTINQESRFYHGPSKQELKLSSKWAYTIFRHMHHASIVGRGLKEIHAKAKREKERERETKLLKSWQCAGDANNLNLCCDMWLLSLSHSLSLSLSLHCWHVNLYQTCPWNIEWGMRISLADWLDHVDKNSCTTGFCPSSLGSCRHQRSVSCVYIYIQYK